jgi:hypothetical protein
MQLGWLWFVVGLVALAALIWSAGRSRELFVLTIEQGRTRVRRGRAPAQLLEGLSDVFARANVEHATVKVVRSDGRARIDASGLDEFTLQRARNVLGTFPVHKLLGKS